MPGITREEFYGNFVPDLESGEAALFIGAGISRAVGFVDWKGLLKGIANRLKLDVDKESDLLSLVQYFVNTRGNRSHVNRLLLNEFTKDVRLSLNHELIASLPIQTVWTGNYDTLLEDAFRRRRKRVDVKLTQANLATTMPRRDLTLYKMHGDISLPHEAILTKEDYERYHLTRGMFLEKFRGDLLSKTFLFLGFSFTDPNIDHVFGLMRTLMGENQREHYCVMRRPAPPSEPSPQALKDPRARKKYELAKSEHAYELRKLELRIEDLKRYSIQTILIDEFKEVTQLLEALNKFSHHKDIFVSGAADEAKPFTPEKLEDLSRQLGQEIIRRGYNLVSGLGVTIGSLVLSAALAELYQAEERNMLRRTLFRPFPSKVSPESKDAIYTKHREQLISESGFVIFVSGNRYDKTTRGRPLKNSRGVLEEFAIAKKQEKHIIPIGATGHASRFIWEEVAKDLGRFYGDVDVAEPFQVLGNPKAPNEELIKAVFEIISRVTKPIMA